MQKGVKSIEINGDTIKGNRIPVNQLAEQNQVKVTMG